jgi:hypothetical protein
MGIALLFSLYSEILGRNNLIRTPDIKRRVEGGGVPSVSSPFACPYTQVDVPPVVTGLCNYMGTITSKILTQLQGNTEDAKTKQKDHSLPYEVKSVWLKR